RTGGSDADADDAERAQQGLGQGGTDSVQPRHRSFDRRSRGGPVRFVREDGVHARWRYRQSVISLAGTRAARRANHLERHDGSHIANAHERGREGDGADDRQGSRDPGARVSDTGRGLRAPCRGGRRDRGGTGMTDVVRTQDLRKTYESEGVPVRALRGVDMTIAAAEFVAVMGPSGCGKSTLLNLIAGLDKPTDGEIWLADNTLSDKDENQLARLRRKHIGIVFQFFNLLEGMSVLENVTLPAIIAGSSRKSAETRARDLLDLLGLSDKAKNAPGVLSGGQRQRLAIARALANQPTLLLADEPTGSLDSAGGAEVLELFKRLHDDGQTIMLVTHDAKVASAADRIVQLADGRIVGQPEPAVVAQVAA